MTTTETTTRRLSRDQVVDAAAVIVRREGMAALSMRALAFELGVSTMAAYRHVPSRRALDLALLDFALGDVVGRVSSDWKLENVALATFAVLREMRGLERALPSDMLTLTFDEPLPNIAAWHEAVGARVRRLGMSAPVVWALRGAVSEMNETDARAGLVAVCGGLSC